MITIILKNPQLPENIGMSARAMLNFNISNLYIVHDNGVNSSDIIDKSNPSSCGAMEHMNIRFFNSLTEALSEFYIVYALSARRRDLNLPHIDINNIHETNHLSHMGQKVAMLFGCEKDGLSNDDICNANYIVNIPTNPNFSSLNLAQSIGIVCFYLQQMKIEAKRDYKIQLASYKEMNYFYNDLFDKLHKRNFFSTPTKANITQNNIKSLYNKMKLTSQEVNTLIGINKMLFGKHNE